MVPGTWEVGHLTSHKGDSFYGLKDMAGNVQEFVLDCIDPGFYAECAETDCVDPVNLAHDDCDPAARGGAAGHTFEPTDYTSGLTTYRRVGGSATNRGSDLGMRCARAPSAD